MKQIALYDKAWDAIFNLPRKVQKKVPEFMQKFRDNSESHAIHLEPISTFSDPQLRTARLNKQYRVIIHAPKTGTMYHLLHVDNHDEAMAWAENKVFDWNENTQSYQVYTTPPADLVTPPEPSNNTAPAAAPRPTGAFSGQSNEELLAVGVPEVLLPSVRQVQDTDGLELLYDYLPIEALENLSMLMEGAEYDTILREVDAGKVDSPSRADQEKSANNQRSFFELTDDELLNQMLRGNVAKWRVFLHPSQRKLVEGYFKGPTKVTGGAGTGKTVAALHRAKTLLERGMATREQPVLFTTYTKALSHNLALELDHLGLDRKLIRLQNIDAFVVESARDAGLTAGGKILDFPGSKTARELWREVLDFRPSAFDPKFLNDEYQGVFLHQHITDERSYFTASRRGRLRRISRKDKMEIWQLVQAYREERDKQGYLDLYDVYNRLAEHYRTAKQQPFRHVIADELQDFSNVHLRLLRSLVAEQADDLFLVGDPLQKIYARRIVFSEAGINVRGRRSRRLKINYRTTERIRRAAINVIEGVDFSDFEEGVEDKSGYVSLRMGQAPTSEAFQTKQEEVSAVIHRVKDYLFPMNGLPLLSSGADICVAAHSRVAIKPIRTALHQVGIPYYDLTETRTPVGDQETGIHLSTLHSLKGLEFKVVLLTDISQQTFPWRPYNYSDLPVGEQIAHDERERALLYVAITRAVLQVHISGVGNHFLG